MITTDYHKVVELKPLSDFYHKNVCIDCGKKISRGGQRCLECENKRRKENPEYKANIDKEELERLIQNNTLHKIGEMYGVSETTIRKRLRKIQY